jgi:hypothetical protein
MLRQPVLGSIPRIDAPEIRTQLEIWHINLVTCMRRVTRAVVKHQSVFVNAICLKI